MITGYRRSKRCFCEPVEGSVNRGGAETAGKGRRADTPRRHTKASRLIHYLSLLCSFLPVLLWPFISTLVFSLREIKRTSPTQFCLQHLSFFHLLNETSCCPFISRLALIEREDTALQSLGALTAHTPKSCKSDFLPHHKGWTRR